MSHYGYNPPHPAPQIVVHDHDVLSGRGVNIAHHPGNQRFRTLVTTRADESYCTQYSASEKKAVAEEIVKHIRTLNPPGRFLKRDGRGQVSRGLAGPWEELTPREIIKKTCQALRDCNRLDRQGYANGVSMPNDVLESARQRNESGLTGKQQAAQAAAKSAAQQAALTIPANTNGSKRDWGRVSPSVENAAVLLKRQKTDEASTSTPTLNTPSTSGSDTILNGGPNIPQVPQYDPVTYDLIPPHPHYGGVSDTNPPPPHPQYASIPAPPYAAPASIVPVVSTETYAPPAPSHPYLSKNYSSGIMEPPGTYGAVPPGSEGYSSSAPGPVVYQSAPNGTYQPTGQSTAAPTPGDQGRAPPSAVYAPTPTSYPFSATSYSSSSAHPPPHSRTGAPAYSTVYQQVQPRTYSAAPSANTNGYIHSTAPATIQGHGVPASVHPTHGAPSPSPIFGGSASPVPAYGAPGPSPPPYRPIAAPIPAYQQQAEPTHQNRRRSPQPPTGAPQTTAAAPSPYSSLGDPALQHGPPVVGASRAPAAPPPSSYVAAPSNAPILPGSSTPVDEPGTTTVPALTEYTGASEYQAIAPAPSNHPQAIAPAPSYEQGDILAPSAGADLLITAANQSTAISSSESLVETLGL